METIFIVGDKFKNFIENDNVISISEFEKMAYHNRLIEMRQQFVLGQGVSSERINKVVKDTESLRNMGADITFSDLNKSGKMLVHKHNPANSMISIPRKISSSNYEANVYIDDRCDELHDHVTGQHISGMLIVESCRQMFLAVTEQFYLKPFEKEFYFVIRSVATEYKKFIFPLDIKIDYRVVEFESIKPGVLRFFVSMDVIQSGEVCATVAYKFSTYDALLIEEKEAKAAEQIIKQACLTNMREEISHEV